MILPSSNISIWIWLAETKSYIKSANVIVNAVILFVYFFTPDDDDDDKLYLGGSLHFLLKSKNT